MKLSAVTTDAGSYDYSYQPTSRQLDTLSAPGSLSLNGTTISTYVYDANGNRRFLNSTEGQPIIDDLRPPILYEMQAQEG